MIQSKAQSQRGISTVTTIFFGLIAAAALFYAYNVAPIYYAYYEFQTHMAQMVRVSQLNTDKEIRQKLGAMMDDLNIPADKERLHIDRDGNHMSISLTYDEFFFITYQGRDHVIQKFHFEPRAEGNFDPKIM